MSGYFWAFAAICVSCTEAFSQQKHRKRSDCKNPGMVFKTGALNRSATHPFLKYQRFCWSLKEISLSVERRENGIALAPYPLRPPILLGLPSSRHIIHKGGKPMVFANTIFWEYRKNAFG